MLVNIYESRLVSQEKIDPYYLVITRYFVTTTITT